jgi:hypothetical protein
VPMKGIYKFVAERMGHAYFPIHTPEEKKLFSYHMGKGDSVATTVQGFNQAFDGVSVFPKLPEHITSYKKIWRAAQDTRNASEVIGESKVHLNLRKESMDFESISNCESVTPPSASNSLANLQTASQPPAPERDNLLPPSTHLPNSSVPTDHPNDQLATVAARVLAFQPPVPPVAVGIALRNHSANAEPTLPQAQTFDAIAKRTRGVDKKKRAPRQCKQCKEPTCKGGSGRGKCNFNENSD